MAGDLNCPNGGFVRRMGRRPHLVKTRSRREAGFRKFPPRFFPHGEREQFGQWLRWMVGRDGGAIARKSGRGLPHYATLRAVGGAFAMECWLSSAAQTDYSESPHVGCQDHFVMGGGAAGGAGAPTWRTVCGLGNPRYGRLGSLRYENANHGRCRPDRGYVHACPWPLRRH